tara:strand:- start:1176 stop:1490 length:315 start_codon:yes stop_codon:yes gene_type:complete
MANDKKTVVSARLGQGVEIVELTDEEQAERVAAKKTWDDAAPTRAWEALRNERNEKLSESDYMANSDVTMSSAWKTYRQELRDLPSKYNDTTVQGTITWPDEPS